MAEGEGGPEPASAGWQNSLMVTVRRLVVTSVTTTLAQRGAISGRQSGSPSTGALLSPGGPPAAAEEGVAVAASSEADVALSVLAAGGWLTREPP